MKKILILFTALLLTSIGLYAQSAPEGMRYQAIARSLDGSLLKGQSLNVQVELLSAGPQEKVFYSEMHDVRSSDLGLLDFVIGEGTQPSGKFSEIPWVNEEMWVRISIKLASDDHYQIIASGQLFSVPYALYATTAGEVKSIGNEGGNRSMSVINWTLEGNHDTQNWNNGDPKLGTTDRRNLVFATNNIHRLVIDKDGMINFLFDVDINGDLNVDGPTTLNGTLTVANMSATSLTGTLTVNKATTLNDELTVTNMANTQLTGSLDVDQTMNVDGATTLNKPLTVTGNSATSLSHTLTVDGTTTLGDDLTVANEAPTSLTGTLDVDKTLNVDGATTLNSTLNVGGNTDLNGTLTVDGITTMNDDLTVANGAPTDLTGDLTVDGDVNAGSFTVDAELTVDGNTHLTGTLDVTQHANLDAGLLVNGSGSVGADATHLAYFNNTEGGSSDGIAIRINNDEMNKENNFMTFYRGSGTVAGRIESYQIGDLDDIPAPTSDEIWSAVCIGLADFNPLSIMWTQMATAWNLLGDGWNALTIPSFDIPDIPAFAITDVPALTIPDVPAFVIPDVPGFVTSDIPGFVIPDIPALVVGPYLCVDEEVCLCPCSIDITDWNCCCEQVTICVIPEFTLFPAITLPDFPGIPIPDFPGIAIPDFPGITIPDFPGVAIPDFPGLEIPAVPELDFSALWGTAPTLPTLSDLLVEQGVCPEADLFDLEDGYFKRLAAWAFEHRLHNLVALDPVRLLGNALAWGLTSAVTNDGAVYGSKGADYAEYLPKKYATEQFIKGEVVGVHNGKISKVTTGADQILAITSQPLVLGNMPDAGSEEEMEKIAFLGQIPVFVMGPVKVGDYIIASGKNDGTAKAVAASDITVDMLSSVLGTAWSGYEGEGITMINTSIGLRPQEVTEVIREQQKLEDHLQQQVQTQRSNSEIMTSDIERMKRAAGLSKEIYNP